MDRMICTNCGAEIRIRPGRAFGFCEKCGFRYNVIGPVSFAETVSDEAGDSMPLSDAQKEELQPGEEAEVKASEAPQAELGDAFLAAQAAAARRVRSFVEYEPVDFPDREAYEEYDEYEDEEPRRRLPLILGIAAALIATAVIGVFAVPRVIGMGNENAGAASPGQSMAQAQAPAPAEAAGNAEAETVPAIAEAVPGSPVTREPEQVLTPVKASEETTAESTEPEETSAQESTQETETGEEETTAPESSSAQAETSTAAESTAAESTAAASRAAESTAAESRAAETTAAESRAAESTAAESNAAESTAAAEAVSISDTPGAAAQPDAVYEGRWTNTGSGRSFELANGDHVRGWIEIDGADRYCPDPARKGETDFSGVWYYFDGNGTVQTGWQEIDGRRYYFESDGAMLSDAEVDGVELGPDGAAKN